MSVVKSIWSNLKMSAGRSGINLGLNLATDIMNVGLRKWLYKDGNLVFVRNGRNYGDLIVYAGKRTLMQMAFATMNDLYPKMVRSAEQKAMQSAYATNQGSVKTQIINNGEIADKNNSQGVTLKYMGKTANEGLLLWIKGTSGTSQTVSVITYWDKIKGLSYDEESSNARLNNTEIQVPTDDVQKVFLDLGASVQVQSANNVILTRVVGRDWSRKELISGGDANFTVQGKIVSNYPDVYPYAEVSRFITLMQHKGILQVYNLMFQQMNITQILIKDFQLSQTQGFKNVQPYSFTCVGIEPDQEVKVVEDTIKAQNLEISASAKSGWTKVLLDKLKETAANQSVSLIGQLTNKYI